MRVAEAVDNWETVLGTEIEVEVIAEISHSMSVIYESRDKKNIGDCTKPGILVHGDQLETLVQRLPKPLYPYAGSEILYIVKVRVLGIVSNTGYLFAPLKFKYIYEVEFDDKYMGVQSVKVNDYFHDIVFKVKRNLTVQEVEKFRSYFPNFENTNELKNFLESEYSVVLVSKILESEFSKYTAFLEEMNLEFEIQKWPVRKDWWDAT